MRSPQLQGATRIARNTIGLFLVSLLAKGSGLIVVVIVARYLGAAALGSYVVIMAITIVLAAAAPMGTTDVAIRAIARDHSTILRYWVESIVVAALFALVFGLVLIIGSRFLALPYEAQSAVDIAAIALIPGGLMWASQAPLQAIEQTRYLSMATLAGRVAGFTLLIVMLESGSGISAALVSHLVFLTVTVVILGFVIVMQGNLAKASKNWDLAPAGVVRTIRTALPFAGQRVLTEASMNANLIILPLIVSVQAVGLFDAADRIRRTISVVMPITMLAVMPEFSRVFADDKHQAIPLAQRTMKYLLIIVLPFAVLLSVLAPIIVRLLYGPGYGGSVLVLQIGAWSLVFLAADMVLKQIMIASHRERSLVVRSFLGVVLQVLLTVTLARYFGITGVAASVLLASMFVMLVDLQFVRRNLAPVNLAAVAVRPALSAAAAIGIVLFLLDNSIMLALALFALAYVIALIAFRAITPSELVILRQLPASLLRKD